MGPGGSGVSWTDGILGLAVVECCWWPKSLGHWDFRALDLGYHPQAFFFEPQSLAARYILILLRRFRWNCKPSAYQSWESDHHKSLLTPKSLFGMSWIWALFVWDPLLGVSWMWLVWLILPTKIFSALGLGRYFSRFTRMTPGWRPATDR